MNDEQRLRDALRTAVTRQPAAGDRVAGVIRVIRWRRRQRERVTAGAVALSLVAGLAVLSAGGDDDLRLVDDPDPSPTASATYSPEPDPEPEPEPSPEPQPSGTGEPSATAGPTREPSERPGEEHVVGDYDLTVRANRLHVKVGDIVTFDVHAHGRDEWPMVTIDYGDGNHAANVHCDWEYDEVHGGERDSSTPPPAPSESPSESPSETPGPLPTLGPDRAAAPAAPKPPPLEVEKSFRYAWRVPGDYTVVVRAMAHCSEVDSRTRARETLTVVVEPGRGGDPTNGPVNAELSFHMSHGAVLIDAHEIDGFIRRIEFDWGDGGPVSTWSNPADCTPSGKRWVGSNLRISFRGYPTSQGSFRGKVEVLSTGCDGGDMQRFAQHDEYLYPPPVY